MRDYSKTGNMPGRPGYRTPASFAKLQIRKNLIQKIQKIILMPKEIPPKKEKKQ